MLVKSVRVMLVLLVCLNGLAGCLNPSNVNFDDEEEYQQLLALVLGTPGDRFEPVDVLALDDSARALIDANINDKWSQRSQLDKLRRMLFHEDGLDINYDESLTKTASETFESKLGNCLSMTNLFVAAARHIGIDARYQIVAVQPTWEKSNDTMIRYKHIVATGRLRGGSEYIVDFLPEFELGARRSRVISDRHGVALYYSNLGAEHIIRARPAQAIRYLRTSLSIEPDLTDTWNNMGAAMQRLGRLRLAEFSFKNAIKLSASNSMAISNLARYYVGSGQAEKARTLERVAASYRQRNPYYFYLRAQQAFDGNDHEEAIRLLNKAIRLKRDADFYMARAESYERLGKMKRSEESIRLARRYEREPDGIRPVREMDHSFWFQHRIQIN